MMGAPIKLLEHGEIDVVLAQDAILAPDEPLSVALDIFGDEASASCRIHDLTQS